MNATDSHSFLHFDVCTFGEVVNELQLGVSDVLSIL